MASDILTYVQTMFAARYLTVAGNDGTLIVCSGCNEAATPPTEIKHTYNCPITVLDSVVAEVQRAQAVLDQPGLVVQALVETVQQHTRLMQAGMAYVGTVRILEQMMLVPLESITRGDKFVVNGGYQCGRCSEHTQGGILIHADWCPFAVLARYPL